MENDGKYLICHFKHDSSLVLWKTYIVFVLWNCQATNFPLVLNFLVVTNTMYNISQVFFSCYICWKTLQELLDKVWSHQVQCFFLILWLHFWGRWYIITSIDDFMLWKKFENRWIKDWLTVINLFKVFVEYCGIFLCVGTEWTVRFLKKFCIQRVPRLLSTFMIIENITVVLNPPFFRRFPKTFGFTEAICSRPCSSNEYLKVGESSNYILAITLRIITI